MLHAVLLIVLKMQCILNALHKWLSVYHTTRTRYYGVLRVQLCKVPGTMSICRLTHSSLCHSYTDEHDTTAVLIRSVSHFTSVHPRRWACTQSSQPSTSPQKGWETHRDHQCVVDSQGRGHLEIAHIWCCSHPTK